MARHLLTEYQVIALRAALAVKGSQTERIAAGIDACRSPVYHQAMAAHRTEVTIRRAAGEGISDLVAPAAERVPGGPDLRLWLRSELDRIAKIRCAKAASVRRAVRPARQQLRPVDARRAASATSPANQWSQAALDRLLDDLEKLP